MDIFHASAYCPTCGHYFGSANAIVNAATIYTTAGIGLVVAAPVALPVISNGIGYGIGWAQGTFGAGTGVLLGKWFSAEENYIIDANELGLNYFNLGKGYGILNYFGDAWVANRAFIDAAAARGQSFLLNQAPFGNFMTGGYGQEIRYLFEGGEIPDSMIQIRVFF